MKTVVQQIADEMELGRLYTLKEVKAIGVRLGFDAEKIGMKAAQWKDEEHISPYRDPSKARAINSVMVDGKKHFRRREHDFDPRMRQILQKNDKVWAMFYRDRMTIQQIAEAVGCSPRLLHPWLSHPKDEDFTKNPLIHKPKPAEDDLE